MKNKFSDYYRKITEEKILKRKQKNEEEAVAGGELAEPITAQSKSNDILTAKPENAHGTSEILGNCDHQHSTEGFFGPGCMHLAKPVFKRVDKRPNLSGDVEYSDLTESEGEKTEFIQAYLFAKKLPQEFLSTQRKINLEEYAIEVPNHAEGTFFDLTTDIFKDVNESVKISFNRPSKTTPFYHSRVYIPSRDKTYSFIPTLNDFVRIVLDMHKANINFLPLSEFNKLTFNIADSAGIKLKLNALDEDFYLEESMDDVMKAIQRNLGKISKGEHEQAHQNSKIDRVNQLPKNADGTFDIGKILTGKRVDSKAKETKYAFEYITDKAIDFVFADSETDHFFLRSFSFKDCMGLIDFLEGMGIGKVGTKLLQYALENQRSGKSTLDNDTSKI